MSRVCGCIVLWLLAATSFADSPATTNASSTNVASLASQALTIVRLGTMRTQPQVCEELAAALDVCTPGGPLSDLLRGVLRYEQGDFPGAEFLLRRCDDKATGNPGWSAEHGIDPAAVSALTLHKLARTLDRMSRFDEELSVMACMEIRRSHEYEETNGIPFGDCLYALKAKALLKQGHTADAREAVRLCLSLHPDRMYVEEAMLSSDVALFEEPALPVLERSLAEAAGRLARASTPSPPWLLDRAALVSYRQGRHEGTREALRSRRTAPNGNEWNSSHPDKLLARLDAGAAEWAACGDDLASAWSVLTSKVPCIHRELRKETVLVLCEVYVAAGYGGRAEEWIRKERLLEEPMRAGLRLRFWPEQWEAAAMATAYAAIRERVAQTEESFCGEPGWPRIARVAQAHASADWQASELPIRMRTLVAQRLDAPVAPRDFMEIFDSPPWMWGEIVRLLGPSLSHRLWTRFPVKDPIGRGFDDAMNAEISSAAGEWAEAGAAADRALRVGSGLAKEEALWRARMLAIQGEAARLAGRAQESAKDFEDAYRINSAVFRLLDVKLPVRTIEGTKAGFVSDAERIVRGSPRLRIDETAPGFTIALRGEGSNLVVQVAVGNGGTIRSRSIQVPATNSPSARMRQLSMDIHAALFAGYEFREDRYDFDKMEGRQQTAPPR